MSGSKQVVLCVQEFDTWSGTNGTNAPEGLITLASVDTSVGFSGCNSVIMWWPTSISEHNLQQFHGWNWTEMVWEDLRETKRINQYICLYYIAEILLLDSAWSFAMLDWFVVTFAMCSILRVWHVGDNTWISGYAAADGVWLFVDSSTGWRNTVRMLLFKIGPDGNCDTSCCCPSRLLIQKTTGDLSGPFL